MGGSVRELDIPRAFGRPARLLFGGTVGVQVWEIRAPLRFFASVLVGHGSPIVMLSARLVGSDYEMDAMNWALAIIATGEQGYSALIAND